MANTPIDPALKAIPILDVAAALGLTLQGTKAHCFNGGGHKNGEDRTPSLAFFLDTNRYRCFGCGIGGDVIDLVRAVRGCSFQDAMAWLASFSAGGAKAVPPRPRGPALPGLAEQAVYARLAEVAAAPSPATEAGKYLLGRALDPDLAAAHGAKELTDPAAVWNALVLEFGPDALGAAGLMSSRGAFLFAAHRLLFFYLDGGRPAFVQARDVTGTAAVKELRPRGLACPVPFNRDVLTAGLERVYVCEGCIDTLSAVQLGHAAVGVPGVEAFRDDWITLFRRVGHVVVAFDNDEAGRRAGPALRDRLRLRGVKADAVHPTGAGATDMNDLLRFTTRRALP